MIALVQFGYTLAANVAHDHAHNHTSHELPLTVHEAFSGIFGSISLACWIFLLLPQLLENYRNQSASAISLPFVLIWFLGDVANLLGALWAGLVPVVVAIAVYFCFSDGLLIGQCLYYGIKEKRQEAKALYDADKDDIRHTELGAQRVDPGSIPETRTRRRISIDSTASSAERDAGTETEPLLSRKHSRTNSQQFTIPGSFDPKVVREQLAAQRAEAIAQATGKPIPLASHSVRTRRESASSRRKSSSAAAVASAQAEPLAKIFEEYSSSPAHGLDHVSPARRALKNAGLIALVAGIGTLGWLIAYQTKTWRPTPSPTSDTSHPRLPGPEDVQFSSAEALGYLSAVLYLCARLPQIWKNYREKSCEGLSLLFFILSLLGNATYGGGILAHSLDGEYVKKNLPWLIGSLGTMVEDVIVFVQFRIYAVPDTAVDGIVEGNVIDEENRDI